MPLPVGTKVLLHGFWGSEFSGAEMRELKRENVSGATSQRPNSPSWKQGLKERAE